MFFFTGWSIASHIHQSFRNREDSVTSSRRDRGRIEGQSVGRRQGIRSFRIIQSEYSDNNLKIDISLICAFNDSCNLLYRVLGPASCGMCRLARFIFLCMLIRKRDWPTKEVTIRRCRFSFPVPSPVYLQQRWSLLRT